MSNDNLKNKLKSEFGIKNAAKLFGEEAADALAGVWSDVDEEFAKAICNYSYGTMYSREVLSQKTRELCAVMTLTALDKQPALGFHVKAALRCGASKDEVREAILQAHLYAGIPCVMPSLATMNQVVKEFNEQK